MIPKEFTIYTNYNSRKEEHKAKKEKRNMLRYCIDKQSRVFWTPNMKLNECNNSIFRFYPVKNMIIYGRCYNFLYLN